MFTVWPKFLALCTDDLHVATLTSPTYNVTVTQLITGVNASDFEFYAIFDSGTSFTYINDPAYTRITESVSYLS